eukprot:COSAG02_NODE_28331_length_591_cov_1.384146_2_plen_63_part_01
MNQDGSKTEWCGQVCLLKSRYIGVATKRVTVGEGITENSILTQGKRPFALSQRRRGWLGVNWR